MIWNLIDALQKAVLEGYCFHPNSDGSHCEHWWDCEPCHFCGFDGMEYYIFDCDCDNHTAIRAGLLRLLGLVPL